MSGYGVRCWVAGFLPVPNMADSAPLPLTVLGGFLGSGKTTLLNHILRTRHGLRVLVMVNDFGSINVDASLIESSNTAQGVINLNNGCVCCTMGGELMAALIKVEQMAPHLDWVIIEGSGVSDPKKIAQIGRAGAGFQLRSIVTLADASSIRETAQDRYVGDMVARQLKSAHLILLNKIDLISQQQRADVAQWLGGIAPEALIVETVNAEIDWDIFFSQFQSAGSRSLPGSGRVFEFPAALKTGPDNIMRHLISLTIEQSAPYDEEKLKQALAELDPFIFRIKGVVATGCEAKPFLLQYSPNGRYELNAYKGGDSDITGKLVVIGSSSLHEDSLRKIFTSAQIKP